MKSFPTPSPLELRQFRHAGPGPVPVQRNHEPQSDPGLRGGYRDHEEGQDLAARVTEVLAESGQAKVDCVEHDLDRDEHQNEVSPSEEAEDSDPEEDGAQGQYDTHGHHGHVTTPWAWF